MSLDLPQGWHADTISPSLCLGEGKGVCVRVCVCVCVCACVHACMCMQVAGGGAVSPLPASILTRSFNTGLIHATPPFPSLSLFQVWPTSDSDFWNFPQTTIVDGVLMNELKLRWTRQKQLQVRQSTRESEFAGCPHSVWDWGVNYWAHLSYQWHCFNWLAIWCCGWLTERA